jgi:hypothetical protein
MRKKQATYCAVWLSFSQSEEEEVHLDFDFCIRPVEKAAKLTPEEFHGELLEHVESVVGAYKIFCEQNAVEKFRNWISTLRQASNEAAGGYIFKKDIRRSSALEEIAPV